MKTISKILAAAFVLTIANKSFGQASVNGTATANIIQPISISADQELKFGSIAANGGGTVIVAVDGQRTRTSNVTLVNFGAVQAAQFTVSGDAGREYVITLPADNTVTIANGGSTMAVNSFTKSITGRGTISGTAGAGGAASGTESFTVGATLTVAAGQTPGAYTGTFPVVVNYY